MAFLSSDAILILLHAQSNTLFMYRCFVLANKTCSYAYVAKLGMDFQRFRSESLDPAYKSVIILHTRVWLS